MLGQMMSGGHQTGWYYQIMTCPQCSSDIIRIQDIKGTQGISTDAWVQVFPRGSNRSPVSQDVPAHIAQDYSQAASVLPVSAKASAALSRRCLQVVLREAGYPQKDLAQQIDVVLNETDPRKALPTGVHNTLDAVRNFGNFSAHPISDQTTLQIIDVEPHEAEYCLDILDAIFDHFYIKPAEAKRRRAALDEKLKAAGKPPSK
jgi:hypothetical protein